MKGPTSIGSLGKKSQRAEFEMETGISSPGDFDVIGLVQKVVSFPDWYGSVGWASSRKAKGRWFYSQ